MTTKWKRVYVQGIKTRYEVSTNGDIRNKKRTLRPSKNKAGYYFANLCVGKKKKTMLVHRLVATAFLGAPTEGKQVDHLDHNPANNKLANLKWVSAKDNNARRRAVQRISYRAVYQRDRLTGAILKKYERIKDIPFGIASSIRAAARGKRKSSYGYKWSYVDEEDLPGEIWLNLSIRGTDVLVSSAGRVQLASWKTYGSRTAHGYRNAVINKKPMLIHRLVAMAHKPIKNPDNFVVHHIDGQRDNNKAENLEWATQSYNATCGAVGKSKTYHLRKIIGTSVSGAKVYFDSIKAGAAALEVAHSGLCLALRRGPLRLYHEYYWEYLESHTQVIEMKTIKPINEI